MAKYNFKKLENLDKLILRGNIPSFVLIPDDTRFFPGPNTNFEMINQIDITARIFQDINFHN